MQFRTKY